MFPSSLRVLLFAALVVPIPAQTGMQWVERNRYQHFEPTEAPQDLEVVDIDGDGDMDTVYAAQNAPARILRNDGQGNFTVEPIAQITGIHRAIAVVDLNGDGHLDYFAADWGLFKLWFGDGNGGFTAATAPPFQPFGVAFQQIDAKDFDSDGDIDLLLSGQAHALLLNDGTGNFTHAPTAQMPPQGPCNHTQCADIDGDGDLEVLTVRGPRKDLYKWEYNGVGFTETVIPLNFIEDFVLADFDNDNRLDLILAIRYDPAQVYRNVATDTWTLATTTSSLDGVRDLIGADVDSDGDQDLVASMPDGLYVFENMYDGTGPLSFQEELVSRETPWVLTPGHLDRGTAVDLVCEDNVFLNLDGQGGFRAGNTPLIGELPLDVAARVVAAVVDDFDGDGFPDIYIGTGSLLTPIPDYINLGRNPEVWLSVTGPTWTNGVFAKDVNGDGRPEVIRIGGGQDTVISFSSTGVASEIAGALPTDTRDSRSATMGNVIDSGDSDDLVVSHGSDLSFLSFSESMSRYVQAGSDLGVGFEVTALEAADINSTQGDELIVGTVGTDYLVTGTDAGSSILDPLPGRQVAADGPDPDPETYGARDIDGDGDYDVIEGTHSGPAVYINEDGELKYETNLFPVEFQNQPVQSIDAIPATAIQSSSAADAVVARPSYVLLSRPNNVDVLLRWDSATNRFVADPSGMPQTYIETTLAMFVDYDGDCDMDILTFGLAPSGGGSGPTLYLNPDRQVEQTRRVRTGHEMEIELHNSDPWGAAPTLSYFLGFSTPATAPLATPFGPFWLNHATLIVLPGGEVTSGGTKSVTIPFPNRPALLGLELNIQALVVNPLNLAAPDTYRSNLIRETVGGG